MALLTNKKSIELSLSFIVVLIMSIVILGFGIRFISQLVSQAKDITKIQEEDFDRQIANLMCEGSEKVCIAPSRQAIKRNEYAVFGIKVINILEPPTGATTINFNIEIKPPSGPPSNLLGYKKNNQPIVGDPPGFEGLIVTERSSFDLKKYEERNLGIAVQVPANAPSGTYILNVEVKANGVKYHDLQKIYVEVP